MPRGKRLKQSEKNKIMSYRDEEFSQAEIAELMGLGNATISRVIAQELGLKPNHKPKHKSPTHKRNISVSATFEDHAMIAAYAKERNIPMHDALHDLLHRDNDLVDTIQREVSVMLEAAKTEVEVIKKKWWQL